MMRNHPISRNRAMVDLRWCDPFPGGRAALKEIMLHKLGFRRVGPSDPVQMIREQLDRGNKYQLAASRSDAPVIVDCSSLIAWAFSWVGILMPRASIDQLSSGESVPLTASKAGDLVFTTGPQNYFIKEQSEGVGHVGILTGKGTVLEARKNRVRGCVVETPIQEFFGADRQFRGACRILPPKEDRLTLDLKGKEGEIYFCKDVLRLAQKELELV